MHDAGLTVVEPLAEGRETRAAAALAAVAAERVGVPAPAMVVAAFDASGVIAWHGTGEPRLDGQPVTRHTVFRIASMTKSFLAATALALVEEGQLDLSADIREYLPYVRLHVGGAPQSVTVRELLSNRSGLPEDNAWGDRQLGSERERIAELVTAGIRLTTLPGIGYQYSNLGMSLVGRAIETLVGHTIEQEIRERFIDPLGLTHTCFDPADYPEGADIAPGFRTFDAGQSFVPEPLLTTGALACIGGLFSTVDDVARWAWFLGSAFTETPDRPDLLSPRSRRDMQRTHTSIPSPLATSDRDFASLGYGLGLFVSEDRRRGRMADHSGGLPGFSSHMRWHVESGVGTVAFGNSDGFRSEAFAVAAHARVLEAAGTPSATVEPWPEAIVAAERFDALMRAGETVGGAAEFAAENLFADVPVAVRDGRVAELVRNVGRPVEQAAFLERIVGAADAGQLRWRIDCEHGSLVCDMRMIGLWVPLVQSLAVVIADAGGRKPASEEPSWRDRAATLLSRNAVGSAGIS
ncbi:serine hydrolase [Leucobacter sp. G161]|uniref:serine hydrolase domain-containing protein n=1 Tax=Leucobacter sp. G161 TaxID=663704 RepID=UPI0009F9A575|nr:serine hydrolase domain-containing protein [Leucobacter sp. G161]